MAPSRPRKPARPESDGEAADKPPPVENARASRSKSGRSPAATSEAAPPESRQRGPSRGRKPRRRRLDARSLRRLAYWTLVLGLWCAIVVVGAVAWISAHLPPIHSLEIPKRPPTIQIVGLNGRIIATRGEMPGSNVSIRQLPPHLPQSFIAIEDRRFYSHFGIDPFGIMRAIVANVLRLGVSQGGSTITQQLAKNLFLTQERTLERKVQEFVLALWLERRFSKQQILELYLNRIYFGSGAYGVEAASQRYFGKSARSVTLAESALLAGLVKSPSRLAPTRNRDGAEKRAHIVLAAMADVGFINEQIAARAMGEAPRIAKQPAATTINYVADWVMDVLNDRIGRVEQDIVVETTIDPLLQAAAEKALIEELATRGERFGVTQGALVAITPEGAVRALIGGRDYAESQFNRAVSAKRQPGSAFKPFVYLTALERGLSPETVREDRPIDVKGWRPENYTREYFGPVSLTRALALSLNTVSVRLTLEVGPQAVVRTAHRLGISSTLVPNASIALGTSEVSVLELVSSFAPFANSGIAITPHIVERVRAADGKLIYRARPSSLGRVVDERHAAAMNAMLHETLVTGTGRRADLPGWPAAGKTGTSQDFRDAWFIGYTSQFVTGVWLGNDDNSPTRKLTGSGMPVDIWSRFMKIAHQGVPVSELRGASGATSGGPPVPPATISPAPPSVRHDVGRPPAAATSALDGWIVDRLFGRR